MAKLARNKFKVQESGAFRRLNKFITESENSGYSRPKDNRSTIGGVEKTDMKGRVVGMSPKSDREMLYKPKNKGQK